jgi:hypothetical protein
VVRDKIPEFLASKKVNTGALKLLQQFQIQKTVQLLSANSGFSVISSPIRQ